MDHLPPLEGLPDVQLLDLPPLPPRFFVSPLQDRPQDPIVEHLKSSIKQVPHRKFYHETPTPLVNGFSESRPAISADDSDVWLSVARQPAAQRLEVRSWDALRPSFPLHPSSTAFLSEQPPQMFASAQEFAMPHVHSSQSEILNVTPLELIDIVMSNIVGNSSKLCIWNKKLERLELDAEKTVLRVRGITEVISQSLMQRFLTIGTLFRRLESLTHDLRQSSHPPTTHAFNHALYSILIHLRETLRKFPSRNSVNLTSLWLHYGPAEELLQALATVCYMDSTQKPPFTPLPTTPTALLSHIYTHVDLHFTRFSPVPVRAMFAFILTTASRDYFRQIEGSVGIGKARPPRRKNEPLSLRDEDNYMIGDELLDHEELDEEDDLEESFPSFMPAPLAALLPRARSSIKILRAASPDHPMAKGEKLGVRPCEWVWDDTGVAAVLEGQGRDLPSPAAEKATPEPHPTDDDYHSQLADTFHVYDQIPGSHLLTASTSRRDFDLFLASFPSDLPSSTPSLEHLARVTFTPLIRHTLALSHSLLHLFLCTPTLNLGTHLHLMRSFMLFSTPAFATRLRTALFTTSDEYQPVGRGTRAKVRAKLGIKEPRDLDAEADSKDKKATADWGIGLGLGLSERGTWPPGGAELGFALRRVVVECLDLVEGFDRDEEGKNKVLNEAEWRLGFAIRDLPIGEGGANWLNPMSIEALDFLYLDYKAPHPIGILISSEILSKYQRVFGFLLRLLRVDTVAQTVFNSTFKNAESSEIFPNTRRSAQQLLHFRFRIQSFVTTLVTYVFDTAIKANFQVFLSQFDQLRQAVERMTPEQVQSSTSEKTLMDIFDIMSYHSSVLDNILAACMLRTHQKALGDLLQQCMETVLEFGRLIGERRRESIDEVEGVQRLDELWDGFERRMIMFVKVLRALDDKSRLKGARERLGARQATAGGGVKDLLLRLDLSDWWKAAEQHRQQT